MNSDAKADTNPHKEKSAQDIGAERIRKASEKISKWVGIIAGADVLAKQTASSLHEGAKVRINILNEKIESSWNKMTDDVNKLEKYSENKFEELGRRAVKLGLSPFAATEDIINKGWHGLHAWTSEVMGKHEESKAQRLTEQAEKAKKVATGYHESGRKHREDAGKKGKIAQALGSISGAGK